MSKTFYHTHGRSLHQVSTVTREQNRKGEEEHPSSDSITPFNPVGNLQSVSNSASPLRLGNVKRFTARTETVMIAVSPTHPRLGYSTVPVRYCTVFNQVFHIASSGPFQESRLDEGLERGESGRGRSHKGRTADIERKWQYHTRTGRTIFIIKLRSLSPDQGQQMISAKPTHQ